jgi:hypothetical protein
VEEEFRGKRRVEEDFRVIRADEEFREEFRGNQREEERRTDGPMQSKIAWITEELLDQRLQDCPQRLAEPTPAWAMLELGDLGHNFYKATLQDESTRRPPLTLGVAPTLSSRGLKDQARRLPLS